MKTELTNYARTQGVMCSLSRRASHSHTQLSQPRQRGHEPTLRFSSLSLLYISTFQLYRILCSAGQKYLKSYTWFSMKRQGKRMFYYLWLVSAVLRVFLSMKKLFRWENVNLTHLFHGQHCNFNVMGFAMAVSNKHKRICCNYCQKLEARKCLPMRHFSV